MSSEANLGKTVTHAVMAWGQTWRSQARNDQPPEGCRDRSLADAVLCRADPVSARDQVRRDMLRMMRHFDVDHVPPQFWDALREAEQVCAQCLAVGRCQRWFHGQPGDDAPRSFCPNAQLYEQIAAGRQQTAESFQSLVSETLD